MSQDSGPLETASIGTTSLPLPPFAVAASPPAHRTGPHRGHSNANGARFATERPSPRSATVELMHKEMSIGSLPSQFTACQRGAASDASTMAASEAGVAWFSPLGRHSGALSGEHVRLRARAVFRCRLRCAPPCGTA